jgi:phosphate transport system substrate-binding protein
MASGRRFALLAATAAIAVGSLAVAGCGGGGSGGGDSLSGNILIDGSSTVAPLSSAAAERFAADNSGVNITVGTSGTGGGFERFCAGETDISDASRAIADDEKTACAGKGIEYEELRVASDGITLVSKAGVDLGGTDLTLEQLKAIWSPGSEINNWKDIPGGSFNDLPMTLAGAGSQSGTYDFFNEEVLGEDASGEVITPRQDYTASEDDNVTVRAVTGSAAGLGYFGFTYYEENMDSLQALSLNGVAPSKESITDGSYPLSRPLFIYVKKSSLERPEVVAFVRFYLENAVDLSEETQFVPAPQDALDEAISRLPAAE